MVFTNARIGWLLVALALLQCGCAYRWDYDYEGPPPFVSELPQPAPIDVAVFPFDDMRGEENDGLTFGLALIPLWPVGFAEYQRPEARGLLYPWITGADFNPRVDMAHATGHSLRRSGLFRDVVLCVEEPETKSALRLRGTVRRTTYEATVFTYMLGVFCGPIQMIGLPGFWSTDDLAVDIRLETAAGEVLWSHTIEGTWEVTQGFYYGVSQELNGFSLLLSEGLSQGFAELERALPSLVKTLEPVEGGALAKEADAQRSALDDQLFKLFDNNKNDQLDEQEEKRLMRLLVRSNRYRDGEIDLWELKLALHAERRGRKRLKRFSRARSP